MNYTTFGSLIIFLNHLQIKQNKTCEKPQALKPKEQPTSLCKGSEGGSWEKWAKMTSPNSFIQTAAMIVYRGWIATLKFLLYQSGWGESSLVALGDTRTGQAENITTNMKSFQVL